MFEKWKNQWKARRLKKLLERHPGEEQIPFHEIVKAVGLETATQFCNPYLDMTEKELVEWFDADPLLRNLTQEDRDFWLSLLRQSLRKNG